MKSKTEYTIKRTPEKLFRWRVFQKTLEQGTLGVAIFHNEKDALEYIKNKEKKESWWERIRR